MTKYVATFNDFLNGVELNGFTILTESEVDSLEEAASMLLLDFTYQVGDEELEFTSGEDLLTRIDFREITNAEYENLKKIFDGEFGVFVNESYLQSVIDELDESNYNDDEEFDFE